MKEIKIPCMDDEGYYLDIVKTPQGVKVSCGSNYAHVPTKALLEAIIDVALDGVDVITDDTIKDMSAQEVAEIVLQLGYKIYSQLVDYTFESCVIHHVIDKRPDRVARKETAG